MTASMTAFARVETSHDWGSLVWEIRTVNHRYLEPHFRLPESMREIEPRLREQLRKNLSRGKVECGLKIQLSESCDQISVNQAALKHMNAALVAISETVERTAKANPMEILRWPGILNQDAADVSQIQKDALGAFSNAMKQIQETRNREGAELKQFIMQRLESISSECKVVRKHMPELLQAQREKITQRLADAGVEIDQNRLEQELVFLAQKADVDEELDRLETHCNEVTRVLNSKGAIGRRLDFLMQELNREANTLGSKAVGVEVTQSAVNLKVLIEQMREQIGNIE
ncbi:YicC family protein [Sansalvadorimonas sp. 2012CJ34-2]|uniref:YicC family protein n=1 Tax=Parendozoicomonas callyspongiae TaxID=2942213 RepID=A0ABT0PGU0_9GAMM|nr:YicC/YloC family endoribonuclease [Sansalvadorimonas sp. 2012CJ34-2]MCL6269728.1 YicC family protein [Sansalvadorimonas sp. 2012CJ34-2]